jgi:hypothetical protein
MAHGRQPPWNWVRLSAKHENPYVINVHSQRSDYGGQLTIHSLQMSQGKLPSGMGATANVVA